MVEPEDHGENTKPLRDEKGYWLPGQTGNPGGRPKGSISLVAILKQRLADAPADAAAIIDKIVDQAMDGNERSQELLINRIDGKLIDRIAGVEGSPILMIQKYTEEEEAEAKKEQEGDEDEV